MQLKNTGRKFSMTQSTQFKTNLKSGQVSIGSWITLAHPAIAEIMVKAGFSWLTIDLEHSVITIREAEELIRVISLSGVTPLVRLTSNDSNQIKRVLDAGAQGIIVPMVNSKLDAENAVAAAYYPPKGTRGVGLARAQAYGAGFADYKAWLDNEGCTVIVQIEHINAVENAEEILSVHGVDGYIIGPYDLSASMGLAGQLDHPEVLAAIKQVRDLGKRLQKPGGVHIIEPDTQRLQQLIQDGFTFLAYSLDIRMLDVSCRAAMSSIALR